MSVYRAMRVLYVAGPYRDPRGEDHVETNIRMAREAALRLWAAGFAPICPHLNTQRFGGAFGLPDETWLTGDLNFVERCDGVVVLPDWDGSEGTKGEIAHARTRGIPVMFLPRDWALTPFRADVWAREINARLAGFMPGLLQVSSLPAPWQQAAAEATELPLADPEPADDDVSALYEVADDVLDAFDFEHVRAYMELTGWKYGDGPDAVVPGVDDLKLFACDLLNRLIDTRRDGQRHTAESGGFLAHRDGDSLSLNFVIESAESDPLEAVEWQENSPEAAADSSSRPTKNAG